MELEPPLVFIASMSTAAAKRRAGVVLAIAEHNQNRWRVTADEKRGGAIGTVCGRRETYLWS